MAFYYKLWIVSLFHNSSDDSLQYCCSNVVPVFAVGTVMCRPFVQDTLIELSKHTHTYKGTRAFGDMWINHFSRAAQACSHTLSLHISECINRNEPSTREGQLKKHQELQE